MRRTILERSNVSAEALAELKTWLGISRPNEDELLVGLLQASLDMCEAFIGQAPLSQLVEERMRVHAGRYSLVSRPVTSLDSAQITYQIGDATDLDPGSFDLELPARGNACFALNKSVEGQAIALQLRAGVAASWDAIPAALRQGLIRLAAYYYRNRDRPNSTKKDDAPPSSVTALWRPWRTVRLH